MISVIIPTLNEARALEGALQPVLAAAPNIEVIVVDDGSEDSTPGIAAAHATVLSAARGRAAQMNRGAEVARGDTLLFLHADTQLDHGWARHVSEAVAAGAVAGTFSQVIDAPGVAYRLIERAGNWRARRLRLFYGDAGVFVTRRAFDSVGGFPDVPIGEEFGFSRVVRRLGPTVVLRARARVSPRRWQRLGIARVTLTNWLITLLLHARVSPARVARLYAVIR